MTKSLYLTQQQEFCSHCQKILQLLVKYEYESNKLWNPFNNYLGLNYFGIFVCNNCCSAHTVLFASEILISQFDSKAQYNRSILLISSTANQYSRQLKVHQHCCFFVVVLLVKRGKMRTFVFFAAERSRNATFLPVKQK